MTTNKAEQSQNKNDKEEQMEKLHLEYRLAQQAIIKQAFDEKNVLIRTLEEEIQYLRSLLKVRTGASPLQLERAYATVESRRLHSVS